MARGRRTLRAQRHITVIDLPVVNQSSWPLEDRYLRCNPRTSQMNQHMFRIPQEMISQAEVLCMSSKGVKSRIFVRVYNPELYSKRRKVLGEPLDIGRIAVGNRAIDRHEHQDCGDIGVPKRCRGLAELI